MRAISSKKPFFEFTLELVKGCDYVESFLYQTEDEAGTLTPVDLTGYTMAFYAGDEILAGVELTLNYNDENGRVKIYVPQADIDALAAGDTIEFLWTITDPGTVKTPFALGEAVIRERR